MKLPKIVQRSQRLYTLANIGINIISPIRLRAEKRRDSRFHYLPVKQYAELMYWAEMIENYKKWYEGDIAALNGISTPSESEKVTGFDPVQNAVRTWYRCYLKKARYLNALKAGEDFFEGMSVLDIGCGPIPHLLAFKGCRRYGLDQLIKEYKAIGFPLDEYSSEMAFLPGGTEAIPVEDNTFDAVISVNAIDHVDDFGKAAREIIRVLKPGGILRLQVHYHRPTVYEPWKLDDQMLHEAFGRIGLQKIYEVPLKARPWEKTSVWSTIPRGEKHSVDLMDAKFS